MANLYSFIILVIAITVHEFAHAFTADRLGDPTPRSYGRISLNPLRHADPIGTFLLPLLSALTNIPTIGWAKPVPIDPYNFHHPKRDENIVALAGPSANLFLALLFSLIGRLLHLSNSEFIYLPVIINLSLMVFNLLPIPPLDGSHVFLNLLPPEESYKWQQAFDQYGVILLLILVFLPVGGSSILNLIMGPVVYFLFNLIH